MRSNVVFLKSLITALTLLLLIVAPAVAKDTSTLTQDSIDSVHVLSDDEDGDEMAEDEFHCDGLPDHDALTDALVEVVENGENGGFALHMWATIVDRDGEVCDVTFSGEEPGDQWPGSRVISAQKANTANAFSLPGLALSTANLFTAVQPGNSLFGLQFSNPVDTAVAYAGDGALFGSANDPMVGHRIGGVNVFGGGLALYGADGTLLGALGTSGDSSCTDHIIAWKVRDALGLDNVPGGVSETGDDNIVYDAESGWAHPECGLGEVEISETLPEAYPIGADEDLSAEAQTDQLIEELVTAVMDVTTSVTEENAEELSTAVSTLLASQSAYRLIGDEEPLGADSQTLDEFEEQALLTALDGETTQEIVDGELRTVVPLTFSQSDATANCAVCHANYDTLVASTDESIVVGAAAFRVPADSAEAQTNQLIEELVTAVMDVTASVTEENAEDLSSAVAELLASQSAYRLIGDADPLGTDSQTLDEFEEAALLAALEGETTQEIVNGELRTVVPLTFSQADATANCAVCHANYDTLVASADETIVVGAAAFRVPADED